MAHNPDHIRYAQQGQQDERLIAAFRRARRKLENSFPKRENGSLIQHASGCGGWELKQPGPNEISSSRRSTEVYMHPVGPSCRMTRGGFDHDLFTLMRLAVIDSDPPYDKRQEFEVALNPDFRATDAPSDSPIIMLEAFYRLRQCHFAMMDEGRKHYKLIEIESSQPLQTHEDMVQGLAVVCGIALGKLSLDAVGDRLMTPNAPMSRPEILDLAPQVMAS